MKRTKGNSRPLGMASMGKRRKASEPQLGSWKFGTWGYLNGNIYINHFKKGEKRGNVVNLRCSKMFSIVLP